MPIDTPEEKTLSDKRAGARTVRKAINKKIEQLKEVAARKPEPDTAIDALHALEEYIDEMIARDKTRKGGLWN